MLTLDGFGDFASTMLATGAGNRARGARARALPALARDLLHGRHAVARLPEVRRRGQGDGPRALRRPRSATCRRCASSCELDGDLFELELDYFVHHEEGVDMTWDEQTPTIGRLFSDRMEAAFGPAREPRTELTELHEDVAAALQAHARGGVPPPRPRGAPAHGLDEPLPRRRRRAERRRERAHPARDAVRRRLRPAGGGRLRHRGRRRVLRLEPGARQAARLRDGARVHRARSTPTPRREAAVARRRLRRRERLDDDELFAHVAERIAEGDVVGWFQGRMEFGPRALGNRSIVVDPRRHDMKDILNARIKHRERVPPVRAVDPRRGDRRLVRAGLHVAVHGHGLQDARREARRDPRRQPRRRHRPPADGRGARAPALLPR